MTDELSEDGVNWRSDGRQSPPSALGSLPLPSVDELFTLLSSHRRRQLLATLERDQAPVLIADVAAEVAAAEDDTAPGSVDEDRRREVQTDLLHNHLPRLHDVGMVTYDRDAGTMAPGERITEAEPLLDVARQLTERGCSSDD